MTDTTPAPDPAITTTDPAPAPDPAPVSADPWLEPYVPTIPNPVVVPVVEDPEITERNFGPFLSSVPSTIPDGWTLSHINGDYIITKDPA